MDYSAYRRKAISAKKKMTRELMRRALRGAAKPWCAEKIKSLQPIDTQELYRSIGKIFPTVMEMASRGVIVVDIEAELGFKPGFIKSLIDRFPKLHEAIKAARKSKLDDVALESMEH
jgi:hypothetical protein